jgi:hypothetical protein
MKERRKNIEATNSETSLPNETLTDTTNIINTTNVIDSYQVEWNPRLAPLWEATIPAFFQTSGSVTPLGLSEAECAAAATLGRRLLPGVAAGQPISLALEELVIFLSLLELVRRELAAEFHQQLQILQQAMVKVIMARTSKQMQPALDQLPKQAEKATQHLRALLKQRGQLLDEVEKVRRQVMGYLGMTEE